MGRCSDARDRLLTTAERLVHERGYTAVSVADICKAAKLKKGSFYHFFPSKHALVLATLDRFAQTHQAHLAQQAERGGSSREQLLAMLTSLYESYIVAQRTMDITGGPKGCPVGNIAQEMAHRDGEIRAKLAEIFTEWRQHLVRLLSRAHDRGELVVHHPECAAEAIMAYVQGSILLVKTTDDPGLFLRIAHGAIALAQAEFTTVSAPVLHSTRERTEPGQTSTIVG